MDVGRMPYGEAHALQHRLVAELKAGAAADALILVEHPPVVTLGRRAAQSNVLAPTSTLERMGITVHHIERGGDVTYHGPGQLVGYPILDLARYRKDVRWYVRALQQTLILTLADFGVTALARDGPYTGVWVDGPDRRSLAKIAAIGVRIERWVTYHGFALNVSPNMQHWSMIVPCGLAEATICGLSELVGPVSMHSVKESLVRAFASVFEAQLIHPHPTPA
jgi:lipoyl(octanoyl) transferase